MAGCCGGDATLAQVAGLAVANAPAPPAAEIGDKVRVRYVGDSTAAIPFDFGGGVLIRLGATPTHRYADVTPAQAAWLAERVPIQVVPQADPPVMPPAPLPTAIRPAERAQALRPAVQP